MTTWTDIPDDLLEPNSPARSIDAIALRDNPIAIAEGVAGAPRIQQAAMADNSVATRTIVDGSVIANKLAAGGSETNWVAGRTAGIGAGSVGSYALLFRNVNSATGPGATASGSELSYSSAAGDRGGAPPGSWRCMGYSLTNTGGSGATLWLRYA